MRVLHWYPNHLGGGGIASAVVALATAQREQGAEVIIAAAQSEEPTLYSTGGIRSDSSLCVLRWRSAPAVIYRNRRIRFPSKEGRLRLQDFRPDIIHVHGEFNVENLWVPILFRVPLVISPHGAFHPVVLSRGKRILKKLYLAVERRHMLPQVASFHALCPMEVKHIEAVFPEAHVYAVPQGPALHFQSPSAFKSVEVGSRPVRLLFIGRLHIFTKGLDVLLDALGAVTRGVPELNLHLTLAGPDWEGGRSVLERQAESLGIASRVHFLGEVPGHRVTSLLDDCDIYIQMSRHDGFSLSVAEALSAGKPALVSDGVGAVSWAEIESLPHVRIVRPRTEDVASALVELITHLDSVSRWAVQHQPDVQQFFAWDRNAQHHLDEYARITGATA